VAPAASSPGVDAVLAAAGSSRAQVRELRRAPRPPFGRLRPIKDALVAGLGAETAAFAFLHAAGNTPGAVQRLPLTGLHDYARTHALRFDELHPARDLRMPPVPVFGEARAGFDARTRCQFACVLADAVVSSKSNFILAGGRALFDHQGGELASIPVDVAMDPVVFAPDATHATFAIEAAAIDGPVLPEAFTLLGLNSFNYWHWQVEFLPRLLACLDLPGFAGVPILVDAQMPAQSLVALRWMIGERHPVRVVAPGEAVRVARLWTAAMFAYLPVWPQPGAHYPSHTMVIDAPAFASALAPLEPRLAALRTGAGPKRLYLARQATQHRGMVNWPEVEAWFAAHDFAIVDFGTYAFEDQLRLARDADVIVGPNGAALVNGQFAGPGTAIGILDNHFVENQEWYADVCTALGQRLSILVGETVSVDPDYEFNANYRIDLERLPAWLEHLLGR
jgi:capsular polysaccharide biosynthesis protein